jgi:hypothetical protein
MPSADDSLAHLHSASSTSEGKRRFTAKQRRELKKTAGGAEFGGDDGDDGDEGSVALESEQQGEGMGAFETAAAGSAAPEGAPAQPKAKEAASSKSKQQVKAKGQQQAKGKDKGGAPAPQPAKVGLRAENSMLCCLSS